MVVIGPPVGEVVAAVREVLADHLPDHATADIARSPIIRRVGGNVLAALTQGSFRVAARGMTDDEIELAIIEELGLIGVRGADAEVTDQPDGSKRIDVRMSDSPYDSLTFEVEL